LVSRNDGRRPGRFVGHTAAKLVWLMHALFLAPTELGNISNIISWGHGIKALLVLGETQ